MESSNKYKTFPDLSGEGTSRRNFATRKTFTIEQAIDHIGFGRAQIKIGLLSGFAWVADGMEIMVLSILGPVLLCEWHISTMSEAFITTVVFIGFFFGSPVFGLLADSFGRRQSLMMSAMWVLYFGILSAFSPEIIWLYILRFLVGFGIGGGPQAITYYAEFLPSKTRGKVIMLVEVLWSLGGTIEAVLAILLMQFGWRWWLLASGFPVLLFVIFTLFIPTSPRYLLACGNKRGAREVLEDLARANNKTLPEGSLLPVEVKARGNIRDLIKPGFRVTSALLSILWFCGAFIYYGLILFTTDLVKAGDTCRPDDLSQYADTEKFVCALTCKPLTHSDYVDLVWTSLAELPGIFLTMILIDTIGRKKTMMLEYAVFAICCFLLFICMPHIPMMVLLFICRALAASAFQTLYVYTPEVYPTEVRAVSVGIGSGFGRIGAFVTPYVAQVLLDWSLHAGLSVYAGISLLAMTTAYLLPIETRGREMTEDYK